MIQTIINIFGNVGNLYCNHKRVGQLDIGSYSRIATSFEDVQLEFEAGELFIIFSCCSINQSTTSFDSSVDRSELPLTRLLIGHLTRLLIDLSCLSIRHISGHV
ncbi:hypothetical protein Hanom_Chr05g00439891 [Helianthus anomalus]